MLTPERHTPSFTRRQALVAGGLGTIGLSLPQLLRAQGRTPAKSSKSIILVVPWGGPSQHDTFDPKPDAPVEVRSLFRPIAARTVGLRLGEHFPRLAALSDRFAILRAVSHSIGTHNPATHLVLTGYPPQVTNQELTRATRADHPTLGSVLAKIHPSSEDLPSYVQLPLPMIDNGAFTNGQNAGFLGTAFDPLVVTQDPQSGHFSVLGASRPEDVDHDRIDARRDLLTQLDGHASRLSQTAAVQDLSACYTKAYNLLRSAASQQAFDLAREPDRTRERYGPTRLGQSVLVARRLVEAGVRLVLVADTTENTNGKWDTHGDFAKPLPQHLRESDQALSALLEDLSLRGLLDTTLVAWMGEFGRTPKLNTRANGGRDHWPHCYSVLLAGGGIRGGQVFGSSDPLGAYPRDGMVRPEDVLATFYHLLGVPRDAEVRDPLGRPHRLFTGTPIAAMF
jgi:uncharacterized protein (DUF1501 family)